MTDEHSSRTPMSAKQERCAALYAEDLLTNLQIVDRVGVGISSFEKWQRTPEFRAAVAEYRTLFCERVKLEGIARVETRVAAQTERWRKLRAVMDARAIAHADHPGGETGTFVQQVKFVKVFEPTKDAQKRLEAGEVEFDELEQNDFIATRQTRAVVEFAVDTGLLAEMRALELQTAKELGQHVERTEHSGSIDFSRLSDEELAAIARSKG